MANRIQVEFGASIGQLTSAVDEVNSSIDGIKSHVEGLADGFAALASIAGAALTFEGLKSGFDQLASFADEVQNAQAKMGGSLESMTTLSGIATMTGVSFRSLTQDVTNANLVVQRSTSDAYGPAAQGLKALGLSAQQLTGLPVDQWFARVSDAVSRFNPSITLTSNVQQAFGRGIAELLPLLMQGSDNFEQMRDAVSKAQQGLSAALPGISETEEKLNLLSLRSRAFAAQVFTTLKPAIDAAIDGFSSLTASITIDTIRDAANSIANYLVDIAASVARFFVQAGISVDQLKEKLANGFRLDLNFGAIDGPAEKYLEWMARLTGQYDRMKDVFSKPISLNFNAPGGDSAAVSSTADQFKAIENAATRAHSAINAAIPASGSWEAIGQDMVRLNSETLEAASSFTKLNAVMADNNVKGSMAARAAAIEEQITAEKSRLAQIKEILNQEASSYKITEQQKALATETAIKQSYDAEMALIGQKEKLYAGDLQKYGEVEKEKAKLTQSYQQDMLKTVEASQKQMQTSVENTLKSFTSAFNSQLRGLLAGTTSWAQATKSIASDLVMKMIEGVEEWAIKKTSVMLTDALLTKTLAAQDVATNAAAEAAKTTAAVTGQAARTAAATTGASAGIASQIAAAVTSVGIDAGKVFAGVFGFLAPVMGPAAAGPAASSEAAAMAGGLAPLAVGAWDIPGTMPALLHPGEMVLPQTFASGLRSSISGGGGGGGSGGGTVFAPNFSGFIGTQAMINQIMPQLARAFRSYQNLNPSVA